MAPKGKAKMAKSKKTLSTEMMSKEAQHEAKEAGKKDKREAEARQLAAIIARGPGPAPNWILDQAAKLRDSQCAVYKRVAAARTIQEKMEEASPFIAFFGGALSSAIIADEEEEVRTAAVEALGSLGETGIVYLDALTFSVLNDKSASVRGAAARALGLVCRSPQKRAARELCDCAVAAWLVHHEDKPVDDETVEDIAVGFGNLTRKQLQLVTNLMKMQAADVEKSDRKEAATMLCEAALQECEKDNKESIMSVAVDCFGLYMAEALPVYQTFCNSILHKTTRVNFAKALDTLLPVAMNDADDGVRRKATESLCELNFSTEPMFAELASTLQDSNQVKRLRGAEAFASFVRISDAMAAETLKMQGHALAVAAMQDSAPGVRQAAAVALGASLTEAAPYVHELVLSLKDEDPGVRKGAARALGAIGEAAFPCIRDLFVAVLDDKDFSVRYWAAESLGAMGDTAVPYIHAFASVALYDVDPAIRTRSNDAVAAVGDLAAEVVDRFSISGDEEEQVRQERAAKALDAVGIPHWGLVLKEEPSAKRKPGKKETGVRGDRKKTEKLGEAPDSPKFPVKNKQEVNRDFACDVAKYLKNLLLEAEAEKNAGEQPKEDDDASKGGASASVSRPASQSMSRQTSQ